MLSERIRRQIIKTVTAAALFCAAFFAFCVVSFARDAAPDRNNVTFSSENPEPAVFEEAFVLSCGTEGSRVDFRQQAVGGKSYFFLPSGAEKTGIYLSFPDEISEVTVKAFGSGSALPISSGDVLDMGALFAGDRGEPLLLELGYKKGGQEKTVTVGVMQSSGIRSVFITSDDPAGRGREYIESSPDHSLTASGELEIFGEDFSREYGGRIDQIKGRGNSTWSCAKKPYQIKLAKKADLLDPAGGTQKAKKWILLSNPFDGTLLHNELLYDLAYRAGLTFTPQGCPVDLYYDGQYRGTYFLCEKVETGTGRIEMDSLEDANEDANPNADLDTLPEAEAENACGNKIHYVEDITNPADITGGYVLEIDITFHASEKSWFDFRYGTMVTKEPEYMSKEEALYISEFIAEIDACIKNGGTNPDTGKTFFEYVDKDSFVRYYTLMQWAKNNDTYTSSTYFYKKPGDDLLYAGPVWDCDASLGVRINVEDPEGWHSAGWGWKWFDHVEEFREAVAQYYNDSFRPLLDEIVFDDENPEGWQARAARIAASAAMNFCLWGDETADAAFLDFGDHAESTAHMFDWAARRTRWMDARLLDKDITRIGGDDRYQTALRIADMLKVQSGKEKFDTVILADGRNYPDALCVSYLACRDGAPVLLIGTRSAQTVCEYIKENLAPGGKVLVIGGEKAVPDGLISALDCDVRRLAGDDRYTTDLEILREAGTDIKELLVCTGRGFADCLSAAAVGKPIMIVGKSLLPKQREYLQSLSPERIYVIGGEAAVSNEVENELALYGAVKRIYGADRHATSRAVADHFFENPDTAVAAFSGNFPDGLCGAPLAYAEGAPVLLVKTGHTDSAADYLETRFIARLRVLGGHGVLDDTTVASMFDTVVKQEIKDYR